MRLHSADRLRSFVGDGPGCKMSQRKLAMRVINPDTGKPISPSFINHLTSGRRKSCTPRIAAQISEALEVPLEILFVPETPSTSRRSDEQQVA